VVTDRAQLTLLDGNIMVEGTEVILKKKTTKKTYRSIKAIILSLELLRQKPAFVTACTDKKALG